MPTTFLDWTYAINKIFETGFFIIAGIVTYLTYLKAKDTILQPMRTEIFIKQFDLLSEIMKLFVGIDEIDLRNQFGFDKFENGNLLSFYDDYAKVFFDYKIDEDSRIYNRKDFPFSIMSGEDLVILKSYKNDEKIEKERKPDARLRAALWSKYKHHGIRIPKEYQETMDKFNKVLESPLLPSVCASLIKEYLSTVRKNTIVLEEIINECAKDMPEKYPTFEDLQNSSFAWIHHKYINEFTPLKPKATEIINFIRSYWNSDGIYAK